MGGGSGPITNPTRLVPFQQQDGTTIKPCLTFDLGPDDIIRLAQNIADNEANFNPIMVNRTGEGYMIIIEKINELIISITEANILKQNTLIIIHRNKKNDENLSERLKIVDTRYYGLSKIIFAVH